ncbi:MAG: sporulation protein YunB [Ruminococcaceae bacterium]|nr:sporulation protein YunB [Oscillospiraceae bacterium]
MINNDRKSKLRKVIGKKLIGVAFILIGVAVLTYTSVRPNIIRICRYTTEAVITDLILKTINEELDTAEERIEYSDLVEVTYSENGRVTSVKSNTPLINRLKTDLVTVINETLKENRTDTTYLSLGTLIGIPFLQGSGPAVEMRSEPKGYANAVFISEFTDAGINQTRHRIVMKTTVTAVSFIPLYTVETTVSTDFLIAETIIVGEIPESYTHVIGASDDTIDKINDYGSNAN